ncbi:MAG: glycosyltransferase family 2 protein [Candidatus Omnitrophota bacterium]|jgi:glycosyltransferase involved in cell wall biosynthesis
MEDVLLKEGLDTPKVSVIIPAYNSRSTLGGCLASIFNSSYSNFEVIVVDDGSTDGCGDICKKFPCKVIKTGQRSGPGKARNTGAAISKGAILLFVDSDCVVGNDWIERMVESLSDDSVAAVGGGYSFVAGPGKKMIERFAFLELKFRRRAMPKFIESLTSCNFACRKGAFLDAKGFPAGLKYPSSEDLEFSHNLSKKYKLLWDKDNGVGHYFRSTISGYLRQQFNFARPLVSLYLRKPTLIAAKTHHKKNGFISIFFIIFFLTGLMLSFFRPQWILLSLASMFITPLTELKFLIFLARSQGLKFALNSIPVLYLRDAVWGYAALNGLGSLFYEILFCKRSARDEGIINGTTL